MIGFRPGDAKLLAESRAFDVGAQGFFHDVILIYQQ